MYYIQYSTGQFTTWIAYDSYDNYQVYEYLLPIIELIN